MVKDCMLCLEWFLNDMIVNPSSLASAIIVVCGMEFSRAIPVFKSGDFIQFLTFKYNLALKRVAHNSPCIS